MGSIANRSMFIDFARGFSILAVVVFHYLLTMTNAAGISIQFISFGGAGVHLFIFIAGFGAVLSRSQSWLDYFRKRFNQILIPYYLFISFLFIINVLIPVYDSSLLTLSSHIFLFKMFNEELNTSYGYHFWFISTIIQFYLFYPLLLNLKNILKNKWFFVLSFLISLLWWIFIYFHPALSEIRIWNSFFLQYLWEFALGMVAADIYKQKKYNLLSLSYLIYLVSFSIAAFISFLLVSKFGSLGKIFNDIFSFIAFMSLAIIAFKISNVFVLFKSLIMFISRISYSLYLSHIFVANLFIYIFFREFKVNSFSEGAFYFLVFLIPSVLFAYAYHNICYKLNLKL